MKKRFKYPYQGRNLFEEPENYFYANCFSIDYFNHWKDYRNTIKFKIKQNHTKNLKIDFKKLSNTGKIFYKLLSKHNKNFLFIINKFTTKYEINKRLFSNYDQNFIKVQNSNFANLIDYILFAKCLIKAKKITNSNKYLSSLIKVCDALCTAKIGNLESKYIVEVLDKEMELVNEIR